MYVFANTGHSISKFQYSYSFEFYSKVKNVSESIFWRFQKFEFWLDKIILVNLCVEKLERDHLSGPKILLEQTFRTRVKVLKKRKEKKRSKPKVFRLIINMIMC